jgi:uncharacterized spore protein YtfJ
MAQIIEGKPIHVEGRTLIPVVRFRRVVRRLAVVGQERLAGYGWSGTDLKPVAIIVRGPEGEHRIPIPDHAERTRVLSLFVALLVPLITLLIAWAVRQTPE